jgi:hypothetical protein
LMLCGLAAVLQASGFDGVAFDPVDIYDLARHPVS